MPKEVLRVYNEDKIPVGWFPIEDEMKCLIFCYFNKCTYEKEVTEND